MLTADNVMDWHVAPVGIGRPDQVLITTVNHVAGANDVWSFLISETRDLSDIFGDVTPVWRDQTMTTYSALLHSASGHLVRDALWAQFPTAGAPSDDYDFEAIAAARIRQRILDVAEQELSAHGRTFTRTDLQDIDLTVSRGDF
ncbi:hypothetical protein ACWGJ9_10060 [Curtobacterium citreum]